jgi:hypothetical protein
LDESGLRYFEPADSKNWRLLFQNGGRIPPLHRMSDKTNKVKKLPVNGAPLSRK